MWSITKLITSTLRISGDFKHGTEALAGPIYVSGTKLRSRERPPAVRIAGRGQRHALTDHHCPTRVVRAFGSRGLVHQEADGRVAIAHGAGLFRRQRDTCGCSPAEEREKLLRSDSRSPVEWIDHHRVISAEADQNMARRVERVCDPADPARCGNIEDGRAHRQALSPVEHADQITVERCIIALHVAFEPELLMKDRRQNGRLARRPRRIGSFICETTPNVLEKTGKGSRSVPG